MSAYNTLNPVPSIDPRDLDDNATNFDLLLNGPLPSYPDRLSAPRKSWAQMELDAAALVSPNVAALAAVPAAVDKGVFFNAVGPVAMGSYTLTAFSRSLGAAVDAPAFRALVGALNSSDTTAYEGSAAKLTNSRSLALTGDGTWTVNFDGSANASGALTLAGSGVTAGTYGSVTVDAKGRATAGSTATPVANGGTGQTTIAAAAAAIAAPKLAWTAYTPTVTAGSGTYTSASATGRYMVALGICYFRADITVNTIGTGVQPVFTLPLPALASSAGMLALAREGALNGKTGAARITSGLLTMQCTDYANGDLVTANGSVVTITGFYPIA